MKNLFRFAQLLMNLKQVKRKGWVMRAVQNAESVADHTFCVSLLTLVLSRHHPESLDREKCIAMALIHDLAESIIGDITPHDGVSIEEKQRQEHQAMQEIADLIDNDEVLLLWQEYEAARTPEARFVKSLDKLETLIQAFAYEQQQPDVSLNEFWEVARQEDLSNWMPDSTVQSLLKDLISQRTEKKNVS